MAAVDKTTPKSLFNASSSYGNFSLITAVQNLNTEICESKKELFSTVAIWVSNTFTFHARRLILFSAKWTVRPTGNVDG